MHNRQQLANYVHLDMKDNALFISSGLHVRKIADKRLQRVVVEACKEWRRPSTADEIETRLASHVALEDAALIPFAVSLLRSGPFLIDSDVYDPEDRFSRHSLYFNLNKGNPVEIQDRLRKAKIAIIGCGGIGNFVAVPLATAGVGHLLLVDHDEVELSNLTRQIMFTESDVGACKVDVLKKRITERNAATDVHILNRRLDTYADLADLPKDLNLIVLSADGATSEMESVVFLVNRFCVENKIPFLNVGYIEDIAVWGPLVVPGKTACQNCERERLIGSSDAKDFESDIQDINSSYQSPSSSPINSLAASAALVDIFRFIGGYGDVASLNKRMAIRTDTFEKIEMPFQSNERCYCRGGEPRIPMGQGGSDCDRR